MTDSSGYFGIALKKQSQTQKPEIAFKTLNYLRSVREELANERDVHRKRERDLIHVRNRDQLA